MPLIPPVFDRTEFDVSYAITHRNDPEHLKGAQNYTDWNRLTQNIHYLADLLSSFGYSAIITCKNDWQKRDMPTMSEVANIRNNLEKLRKAFFMFRGSVNTPNLPLNTYQKINDAERILFEIDGAIAIMAKSFRPLNTFWVGADLI